MTSHYYWIVPIPANVADSVSLADWAISLGHVSVARPRVSLDKTQAVIETVLDSAVAGAVVGPMLESQMREYLAARAGEWIKPRP